VFASSGRERHGQPVFGVVRRGRDRPARRRLGLGAVSPLFYEPAILRALPPTTIYVGEREILHPDTLLLYWRGGEVGAPLAVVMGTGLIHDWPMSGLPLYTQTAAVRPDIVNSACRRLARLRPRYVGSRRARRKQNLTQNSTPNTALSLDGRAQTGQSVGQHVCTGKGRQPAPG
jgi:acetyl esterase/lipase